MNKLINMSSIENLDIKQVLMEHSRAMFDGGLDEIVLGSKGSIILKLEACHQSDYWNFIIINVYDKESKYGFQYSHPILDQYEETDWELIYKFYNDWKEYFNTWNDVLEKELMVVCNFQHI